MATKAAAKKTNQDGELNAVKDPLAEAVSEAVDGDVETRVLAIANHKGGVGKTTTSVNLADALAQRDKWVLVIDLDPQTNASKHIGKHHPARVSYNARELLINDKTDIASFIHEETNLGEGVHLIYGSIALETVHETIRNENPRPAEVLKERLRPLMGLYDYIIIDCPPSLNLLTQNAIAAATHYLIPVESGAQYAIDGLDDLKLRVEKVMQVNKELSFLGALLIKHDERQILCKETEADAETLFGKLIPVTISQTAKVNQSVALKVSVRMAERNNKVALQYKDLAEYIDNVTAGQGRRAEEDY